MKYPFLIPAYPEKESFLRHLDDIYNSGWLSNAGPKVLKLEEELARLLEIDHVICAASGSMALLIALRALDLPAEKSVLMPSFNFPAGAEAALWNGLSLQYGEIRMTDLTLDPGDIKKRADTQTRVVMPVHTFGNLADTRALGELSANRGWSLIYDGASAIGSLYLHPIAARAGLGTILSLHVTKILPAGEGGAILTADPGLARECRRLINFGFRPDRGVDRWGINAKMSELQAAFALAGLESFRDQVEIRRELAGVYREELQRVPWLEPRAQSDAVMQLFPVSVRGPRPETARERLKECWADHGIEVRYYYTPALHTMPVFRTTKTHPLPISEEASQSTVCLPFHTRLRPETIREIVDLIEQTGDPG